MSTLFVDSTASALMWIVIKASALLAGAALVQLTCLRRASAASRHAVWTIALLAVLLLPVVSRVLPQWSVVVRSAMPSTRLAGSGECHPPGLRHSGCRGVPRVERCLGS